jgi:vacuolar protein-sorting-associated protein 4
VFRVHVGEAPHNPDEHDFKRLGEHTGGFSGSEIATLVKDVVFQPVWKTQDATHFKWKSKLPEARNEQSILEPCSPGDPEAFEATLETLDQASYTKRVVPPPITREDFERALVRARPTVSAQDIKAYDDFTHEFGESAG